jgi:hypothetical protein
MDVPGYPYPEIIALERLWVKGMVTEDFFRTTPDGLAFIFPNDSLRKKFYSFLTEKFSVCSLRIWMWAKKMVFAKLQGPTGYVYPDEVYIVVSRSLYEDKIRRKIKDLP